MTDISGSPQGAVSHQEGDPVHTGKDDFSEHSSKKKLQSNYNDILVVTDYHQHSTFLEANKITILAVGASSGL